MSKLKYVITGCNGFTGGYLCRLLTDRADVVGVSRSKSPDVSELERSGVRCVVYEQLESELGSETVLIHCAGRIGQIGKWEEYKQVNIDWTGEIFKLCSRKEVPCFVYISSVAAQGYANRDSGVLRENDEPDFCRGELYGRSKRGAERLLVDLAKQACTRLVVLRPGLIYDRQRLSLKQTWLRRGFVVDPCECVSLVHIRSVAKAVESVVFSDKATGIYNLVDDVQPKRCELIDMQLERGLLMFRPWRMGVTGFLVLNLLRQLKCMVKLGSVKPQAGYLGAALRFHRRRNRYDTTALQRVCNWRPRKEVFQGDGLDSIMK